MGGLEALIKATQWEVLTRVLALSLGGGGGGIESVWGEVKLFLGGSFPENLTGPHSLSGIETV
jgi:hypothetical protein